MFHSGPVGFFYFFFLTCKCFAYPKSLKEIASISNTIFPPACLEVAVATLLRSRLSFLQRGVSLAVGLRGQLNVTAGIQSDKPHFEAGTRSH